MNSLVLFISGCALFTLVLSSPQDEPNDATVVTAANTNTRLFTDDANTNNAIAGGLLGVGVGVGGVLLPQAFSPTGSIPPSSSSSLPPTPTPTPLPSTPASTSLSSTPLPSPPATS